jgi:transcriptional regulator with XRE-family HTH domain
LERGLSPDELADRLGIGTERLESYERGAERVGLRMLFELAKILETLADHLLAEPIDTNVSQMSDDRYKAPVEDSLQLMRAFAQIADPGTRALIIAMARLSVPRTPDA